jgi:hypothetical protein
MATKKDTTEPVEAVQDNGAIPEVLQALEKRLEKIEKRDPEFTDSKSIVNAGPHPIQIQ